jgi:hypothetical protein
MLKVDRAQFIESVQLLDGMIKRKRQAKAVLTFKDGALSIKIANTIVNVYAVGDWPGSAKIGALMLLLSISPPPASDPVTLSVEGDRMRIERRSTACEWIEASRHRFAGPVN